MKKLLVWMLVAAGIMLVLPWLTVTFVKGDIGMAICFLLFFAGNPVYAIISGAFAGKDIRALWAVPAITGLLFLAGTWLLFDPGETAFLRYALIYLALGSAAMLISHKIR